MTDISFPQLGDPLAAHHRSSDLLALLAQRRSTMAVNLQAPGPAPEMLDQLLQIASRVPDHRKLVPFRFVVFEGDARAAFGDVVVAAARLREDDPKGAPEDQLRGMMMRAPVVVTVISSVNPAHRTPVWEQVLTAGAVCQNLLLAASAAGFAGQWISEWLAYDDNVGSALGLGTDEKVAGFILLGTAKENPKERPRPDARQLTTRWQQTP